MKLAGLSLLALFAFSSLLPAQNPTPSAPAKPATSYSGMYSFQRDGEFVQLTVEDDGRVNGFVSRYGDTEGDRGAFLDQFFKKAALEGTKLSFTTDVVHGVWYEFKGEIARGEGKAPGDEAYYVLRGTLTESRTGADQKVATKAHEVVFKSFPQDAQRN
jgi:hypothetical protein